MEGFLCLLIGYVFGSFQSSYIFVRRFRGTDIRDVGSGNAGMTNTLLSYGKQLALAVLFCDMMKTILASIICSLIVSRIDTVTAIALACLGTALGHNFPFWLKLRGGKGVAVAVATSLVLDVRIFIVAILMAAVFAWLTKSATYGSYTFAVMLFICTATFGYGTVILLSVLAQSLMISLLHVKKLNTSSSRKAL